MTVAKPDKISPSAPIPLSVLCIDDDPDVLVIVQLALGLDKGFTVRTETNSIRALKMLLEKDYHPDCIVIDVCMPGIDGTLLLGDIRNIPYHAETPVVLMTGHVREHQRKIYSDIGVSGVIAKPFDPITLAAQIRSIAFGI